MRHVAILLALASTLAGCSSDEASSSPNATPGEPNAGQTPGENGNGNGNGGNSGGNGGSANGSDGGSHANADSGPGNPSGPTGGNAGGSIGNCQVFPSDNPWNTDISQAEADPNSNAYIARMNGNSEFLHPDFGSNLGYGIPYVVVPGTQPKVPVSFQYASQSDPGPYPIPPNAPVEGAGAGGDRHILVIDKDACKLYEMYASQRQGEGWRCGSGAVFDLRSNALRPDGWTSADAAGLPIFPGLARYDEAVELGEIRHALRFTASETQNGYVHPATHQASDISDSDAPPMGLRVRLKANYDISRNTGAAKVILTALKKYGMFLADNGSDWFVSGAPNENWDDDNLRQLKKVPGSAFEVVKVGTIRH